MTNENTWQYLADRYCSNNISKEELDILLQKVASEGDRDALIPMLQAYSQKGKEKAGDNREEWDRKYEKMMREVKQAGPVAGVTRSINRRTLYRSVVTASIIVLVSVAGYTLLFSGKDDTEENITQQPAPQQENDLGPGSNGAILTLADGKQIILDSAGNGHAGLAG
ncbi:MAG: hypothetical protein JNL51_18860 [Chitinophagaceae bacterium]|nr:hypothetical protein [Chitinophagaceae bacterium]